MNTQSFTMVRDNGQYTFYPESGKTKKQFFIFFTILAMVILSSCKKSIDELPGQGNVEAGLSNQSARANVSSFEELVPYDRTLFVPCGNGGAGEEVTLTGSLKIVEHIVYNDHGFTFNYHVIVQGVTGVGLSTGQQYQVSGGNKGTIAGEFGEYGQYTNVFMGQLRIIGQNSVFKVMYKTKITITPDGKITTSMEEETVDCNM